MISINYNKVADLSGLVRSFCHGGNAWIVGGGAKYLLDLQSYPRDWDILVPSKEWDNICRFIPEGSLTNSWGGIKIDNVDVWPGDLTYFITAKKGYAVNPKSMTWLKFNQKVKRNDKMVF